MKYLLIAALLITSSTAFAVSAAEAEQQIVDYCVDLYKAEPGNYSMIEFCIDDQIESFNRLNKRYAK